MSEPIDTNQRITGDTSAVALRNFLDRWTPGHPPHAPTDYAAGDFRLDMAKLLGRVVTDVQRKPAQEAYYDLLHVVFPYRSKPDV